MGAFTNRANCAYIGSEFLQPAAQRASQDGRHCWMVYTVFVPPNEYEHGHTSVFHGPYRRN